MTPDVLMVCTGARVDRARTHAPFVTQAMDEFEVNTPARQAAFLAQIGHESGGLHWSEEIWGPTTAQVGYEPPSEKARELGNTQRGDGVRFKGRGWIQLTGRTNYRLASAALGVDIEASPTQLALPGLAARSAGWFWKAHGLNQIADDTSEDSFIRITRILNGGTNGLPLRLALWNAAKAALGVA